MNKQRDLDLLTIGTTAAYGIANEVHKQRKLASGQQLTWREQHYWQYLWVWCFIVTYLMMSLVWRSLIWPVDAFNNPTYHQPAGLTPAYCQSLGGFWDGAFCEENSNWAPGDPAYVRFYNDPLIQAQNAQ